MYTIDSNWLTLDQLSELIKSGENVQLSEQSKERVAKCRAFLDEKVKHSDQLIWGNYSAI